MLKGVAHLWKKNEGVAPLRELLYTTWTKVKHHHGPTHQYQVKHLNSIRPGPKLNNPKLAKGSPVQGLNAAIGDDH